MPNMLAANPEDDLWESLPDHLLLHVFQYLGAKDLCRGCQVCRQWNRVSKDEFLWRDLFYTRWKIDRKIPMSPGKSSWLEEYKRLYYHVPCYETEVIKEHKDQVLHVSFSHDGQYFATSSKDGWIKVWTMSYPCGVKYKADMKEYTWKYTQFTQFNATDTLLLVSGVHFGSHSTSGEIAVFDLTNDFQLQCRVQNKPYDIFGTWYNDSHLLSGNLHWVGNLSSCSVLWLNKASQELESEWQNVVMRLFKFLNVNASSIRTIFVSSCPDNKQQADNEEEEHGGKQRKRRKVSDGQLSPKSNKRSVSDTDTESSEKDVESLTVCDTDCSTTVETSAMMENQTKQSAGDNKLIDPHNTKQSHSSEFSSGKMQQGSRNETTNNSLDLLSSETLDLQLNESQDDSSKEEAITAERLVYEEIVSSIFSEGDDVATGGGEAMEHMGAHLTSEDIFQRSSTAFKAVCENTSHSSPEEPDKYLIFTTGSMTYTPHQIGIKRIRHEDAIGKLDKLSRERWIREQQLKLRHQQSLEQSSQKSQEPADHSPGGSDDSDSSDADTEDEGADGAMPFQFDPPLQDDGENGGRMDSIDHLIEMNGHIIGMQLTPDQRYLYVNTRAWPKKWGIENPLEPPPIAQQIEIHVIDLLTLKDLGVMHFAHKAYTPNDECFFIFLDVCSDYVASGAEDKYAYLWERHYRTLLSKYPHNDVVNSVAFHPKDTETMVSVSDDFKIKIWRSKNRCRQLGIEVDRLTMSEQVVQLKRNRVVSINQASNTCNAKKGNESENNHAQNVEEPQQNHEDANGD